MDQLSRCDKETMNIVYNFLAKQNFNILLQLFAVYLLKKSDNNFINNFLDSVCMDEDFLIIGDIINIPVLFNIFRTLLYVNNDHKNLDRIESFLYKISIVKSESNKIGDYRNMLPAVVDSIVFNGNIEEYYNLLPWPVYVLSYDQSSF